jgi:hypothetical protein
VNALLARSLQHNLQKVHDVRVVYPLRHFRQQPVVPNIVKEVPDVGVKYMVHLPAGDRHRQGVQRIVRPSSRSEPVREPEEISTTHG